LKPRNPWQRCRLLVQTREISRKTVARESAFEIESRVVLEELQNEERATYRTRRGLRNEFTKHGETLGSG